MTVASALRLPPALNLGHSSKNGVRIVLLNAERD
jgi:hypothetical protein